MNADEVEDNYSAVMGPKLGPIYNRLQSECTMLNSTWQQFIELFATSDKRIEVIDWSASYFFRVVRDVFLESTLLRICRITDPPSTGKKNNVSLALLLPLVGSEIREQVKDDLEQIKEATEFARDWRNRHIAHHDFAVAFDEAAIPLATVTRKKVDAAIAGIGSLLNLIERHYSDSEIAFDHLIAPGQADDLVQILNERLADEQEFLQRLESRTLSTDDFPRRFRERI